MLLENVLKPRQKDSSSKKIPEHKILGAAKHSMPVISQTSLPDPLKAGSELAGGTLCLAESPSGLAERFDGDFTLLGEIAS